MRWLLIIIFLVVDFLALLAIVRAPLNSFYADEGLNFGEEIIANPKEVNRIRRNLVYGRNRWRSGYLTKTPLTKGKPKPKHAHRHHEKFAFILRCPTLPENEPKSTSKLGVEWSLNSDPYLRIISNGKRFESFHIAQVEEWRNINGQLNAIAYGPKLKNYRYKFEYEESRGWFALKIKNVTEDEVGIWQCRIKLRFPNSTILHFESRKIAKLPELPSEVTQTPRKIFRNYLKEENDTVENKVINYSEPPLFSFSKNDGEYTVFSRVDKRRDLLAYVRTESDINKTPKLEKRKRFNYCPGSSTYNSYNLPILILTWIINF